MAPPMTADVDSDQFRLARTIVGLEQTVAQAFSGESYGHSGSMLASTDACLHLEFLAGAIASGSPDSFADYMRWTARMLGARGIASQFFEDSLQRVEYHLATALTANDRDEVSKFLAAARVAYVAPVSIRSPSDNRGRLGLTRRVYLTSVLSCQQTAAAAIIAETLKIGHSIIDIYVDVLAESQHEIGELWELNKITTAQEHAATAITQDLITGLRLRQVPAAIGRGAMVVAVVPGEMHRIGADLFADTMSANGWAVRVVGTGLSNGSVLEAVEESSAEVLCIGATLLGSLPGVMDLVRRVRVQLKDRAPKIVFGGAAFGIASAQFALDLGATVVTDLRHGVAVLCGREFSYTAKAAR